MELKQNATQSIAERMTVTTFKRFERDHSKIGIVFVNLTASTVVGFKRVVLAIVSFLFNTLGSLHR